MKIILINTFGNFHKQNSSHRNNYYKNNLSDQITNYQSKFFYKYFGNTLIFNTQTITPISQFLSNFLLFRYQIEGIPKIIPTYIVIIFVSFIRIIKVMAKLLSESLLKLNNSTFKAAVVGIRPFRKGGLRIQTQFINGKCVVHNYGHGGAGISLAPATSKQAVSLILQEGANLEDRVAILGSGIVGLFSALEAAQLGFKVTIYAERIPEPNSVEFEKMCTSQVPPGYWLPYSYQIKDQQAHQRRSLISFQQYMKLSNKSKNLSQINVIQPEGPTFSVSQLPLFMRKHSKIQQFHLGNIRQRSLMFPTIQINLQPFLQELMQKCRELGVQFHERKFNSKANLADLTQQYVINCLGLGSKQVFGDQNVYGVKGYLLRFQNLGPIKWGIYGFDYKGVRIKFYMLPNKVFFGVMKKQLNEERKVEEQKLEEIKKIMNEFISEHVHPSPKL